MKTASSLGSRHWPPDAEPTESPLSHYFSVPKQDELLDEDRHFTRTVATELISVLAAALAIGIAAVVWILITAR